MSFRSSRSLRAWVRLPCAFVVCIAAGLAAAGAPAPASLTGVVLGDSPSAGTYSVSNGVPRIRVQGAGLGGRADQGYFAYTGYGTNDFDWKVRVTGLESTALSARAGLMVREQTDSAAVSAAIVVTPGINGVQFLSRNAPEGLTAVVGSYPGNIPYAWLRLQRSNDVVRGLASLDGRRWTQVGRVTLPLAQSWVGLAASSARTNDFAVATFDALADANGESEDPLPSPLEPPGPSSRRTALAITEILYNPVARQGEGERPDQFVEVFNSDFTAKELGGHRLEAGEMRYVFPTNVVLPAGGYLVVAKDPARLRLLRPGLAADRLLGPWEGDLDRDRDTLQLWSPFGALLLEVPYTDHEPWPLAPDGEGHTLVLARPSWGEGDPRAWSASPQMGGSAGAADAVAPGGLDGLRITEVYGGRGGEVPPFVEIFNAGADPAPLNGLLVMGPLDVEQPLLPLPDTTLAPGERVTVGVPESAGVLPSPLFLRQTQGGRVLDAVTFQGPSTNAPLGRAHLERPAMRRLTAPTPARPNAPARRPRVVIAEVMYKPIGGRDDDQYLELWNPGSEAVSLGGWRLADGVEFSFPAGRGLAPGERAVVARNAARLQITHTNLTASRIVGEFSGRLGARGERLTLLDDTGAVEFGFTYGTGGEWPSLADGGGSSLELLHPDLDPDLGSSWAASDESGRAAWQTYEITGLLETGTGTINDVRLFLLGAGETLVDDVEVFAVGSTNLLTNPTFESGPTGWTMAGTHERSGLSTLGGFGGSSQALHLRAAGRGDNGINSVRAALRTGLRPGTNTTLRLRARWLAGARDLILRVKGNFLELPVRLAVPEDLGSPGLPNSRSLPAFRPALSELAHFPVLPAEGQPVRVTVRISGDPGTDRPVLRYRLDPATEWAGTLPMNDAGADGDRVPGDGVYTAVLPGGAARSMAAFHVTLGPEGTEFRVPRTSVGREALVRWGEPQPGGNLGTYRIWITRATETRWNGRAKLHNGDLDGTFVYGTARAVYGLGTLYSGSPFVSPGYNGPAGSTLCGYVLHFPDDEPVLGETDFVMDWPIRDDTRQLEQRAYEFAAEIGLPYLHRRFVHLYVNSTKRGPIFEDTQQPGSAYLRNWSPGDDDGNLHKIEDWFEFTASGEMEFNDDARLEDFRRSDDSRNIARYRWNFRPRSVQESAHDFSALFRLIDAAVTPAQLLEFERDLAREMDIEEWAGVFAVEHAVGNWDSFGYSRGKNMYAYRPERGPWKLYMWDIDFVMSASGEGPGNWLYATIDPTLARLYQYPMFQRAYLRAIKRLVDGPMAPDRFSARLEAVRAGLVDNGVVAANITAARNYVRDQRTQLLRELENVDRSFTVESGLANGETTDAVLLLQGQAPLEMTQLRIRGEVVPVRWITPDRWYAAVPLEAGRQALTLVPLDGAGRELAGTRTLNVNLTQAPEPETQRVVINEIHASPRIGGAEFVELFNPSSRQSIDLSGMQVVGSGVYEFPRPTVLPPREFVVLGGSVAGFQEEFGRSRFPTALLGWSPRPEGDTVALVRPAQGTNPAVTLTGVTYRDDGPWPETVGGRSIQLRDASRGEDERVGAWTRYAPPTNSTAWKEFSVTRRADGTNLLMYVTSFPPSLAPGDAAGRWIGNIPAFGFAFVVELTRSVEGVLSGRFIPGETSSDPDLPASDLGAVGADATGNVRFTWLELNGRFSGRLAVGGQQVNGTFTYEGGSFPFNLTRQRPPGTVLLDDLKLTLEADATDLLRNGDFEAELGGEWKSQGAHASSGRVELPPEGPGGTAGFALRLIGTLGGDGSSNNVVSQAVEGLVPGATYRLSGRYRAVEAQGLFVGLPDGPTFTADLRPRGSSGPDATPGRANSVAATLDPIPLVWVNEVLPDNVDGLRDAAGEAEPWIELHNSGSGPAALDGYFITDDPQVPGKWAFAKGTQVPAGGFLIVWLDGEASEGTPDAPHAAFRPPARDGVVVLSRQRDGGYLTVDYLRYGAVPRGATHGHLPETWLHSDDVLPRPTPGQPNGSAFEPDRLWINEWMASNDGSIRDPADQDADDWFELYNPGSTAVDLEGWFLTDTEANPAKFRIPAGYRVPPGGFLLVWADEEGGQNQVGRPDLHVNFRLSADGEAIGLYRPDGSTMDLVRFGAQTAGVSQGRAVDGATGTNHVAFAIPTPGRSNQALPATSPDFVSVERRVDGTLRVRFVTRPGARYRLRAKEDLSQSTWTPATETVTATGSSAELEWPGDGASQRFLQVERLP